MTFQKATRKQAKLKVALQGPSGSGKTLSALKMARAMGKKIAVIDTENGSASLYADRFEFDTVNLQPPFESKKFIDAITSAEQAGYDVIILDSFSHAWAGEGAILDKKSALDARGGNQFTNWRDPKQEYNRVKNAILHSTSHVICTIRSKQAYILVEDNGKQKPQKVGLDPIAEPGVEYEYTVVFDIAADHNAMASKDRTSLFEKRVFRIEESTGEELMTWLMSAKPADPAAPTPAQTQDAPKQKTEVDQNSAPTTTGSGVACKNCGAEMILHRTGQGYVCPNSKGKDDGHTRFSVTKLAEFQKLSPFLKTAS